MMHRDERLARRVGQPLGVVDPHQHRANQPRRKGDGHAVHLPDGQPRVRKGLVHHAADGFRVAAAGDFRHHTAVQRLLLHAGGDHVGHHRFAILHHRGGGLIAGGFNS